MKRMFTLLLVLSVSISFAQKERTLELNKETNLIEVTYFHDNGVVSQTGYYTEDGKLQGDWFKFDADGQKIVSAQYDNGLKVGAWFYWKGDQIKKVEYSSGSISFVSDWQHAESAVAINEK